VYIIVQSATMIYVLIVYHIIPRFHWEKYIVVKVIHLTKLLIWLRQHSLKIHHMAKTSISVTNVILLLIVQSQVFTIVKNVSMIYALIVLKVISCIMLLHWAILQNMKEHHILITSICVTSAAITKFAVKIPQFSIATIACSIFVILVMEQDDTFFIIQFMIRA